ncbi:MAG: DUF1295 domain-containing protein [Candidatus Cloacimonetes bacterium]|nr:DUF1295 domain-containing protein [Candidatus Cloacimonadota bacterium]
MALREDYVRYGQLLFKYRSYVPLVLIPFYLIVLYIKRDTLTNFTNDYDWTMLCFLISFLGIIIRSIAVGYAAPNTSGRNVVKQKADSLNTTGIYSIVRHPLYLGNSLIWLGISMRLHMFWVSLSVMLFFWMYYEKIMFTEEEYLRAKFGKVYEDWANSIPTLLPNFKKWKKNTNPFSFKKVLRQENDGVYALIVILFFIELSADYFHDFDINISLFWIYIISVFTFLYLLVKLLKKQTKLLK